MTLCLGNVVADLLILGAALLPGVVHCVAALGELCPALLLILCLLQNQSTMPTCVSIIRPSYLDWFLDVAALPVLDLFTFGLKDVLSLMPGHLPVLSHCLLAVFLH